MSRASSLTRRQFVKAVAAAGAAGPLLLTSRLYSADPPPSERLNLGFIGVGTQGHGHVQSFAGRPEVQIVAVSDVVVERRDRAKKTVEDALRQAERQRSLQGLPGLQRLPRSTGSEGVGRRGDRHAGPLARHPDGAGGPRR